METEKQNNYYLANQFQVNAFFLHHLKTGKERKHWPKWVDNSGREIISIQNNATLIYGINGQNTTSTSASNNNVINGVTIFISEKFKGSCE